MVRKREPGPRPDWLTVKYVRTETYETVAHTKEELGLVTVCEEARCPKTALFFGGSAVLLVVTAITSHFYFFEVQASKFIRPKLCHP